LPDAVLQDFDLRLKVKLTGTASSMAHPDPQPAHDDLPMNDGYQADMGEGYWGSLYDESRRNKVLAHPHAAIIQHILKPNDWNDYIIRCEPAASASGSTES